MLLQKANHIRNIIEKRDTSVLGICSQSNDNCLDTGVSESVCYNHTLDIAYRFFKMAMSKTFDTIPCQVCQTMFALMQLLKNNKMYNVRIVLSKHTTHVERAICVCPAGLSGCCNHVTATLYCVEDYFR